MLQNRGLIDFKGVEKHQILDLFLLTSKLKNSKQKPAAPIGTAALVFFEASTRTRVSFEKACVQSGFYPLRLDSKESSSLSKGETPMDTMENIAAMQPDVLIVRAGTDLDFQELAAKVSQPIFNAGWGASGHPTQALLDAFTLWETKKPLENEKLVIVGDVDHSRVASSHQALSKILGYELKFAGPAEWTKTIKPEQRIEMNAAYEWATSLMFLRVQNERHEGAKPVYEKQYSLSEDQWKKLKPQQNIMHPGPINYGVEMDAATARHAQSMVLRQVTNGVFVRQALLQQLRETL